MDKFYHETPIGILEFVCDEGTLFSLKMTNKKETSFPKSDFANEIIRQLNEYLTKQRKSFDIPIKLQGTDFQKKVWLELLKIPYGTTKSYFDIATLLGNKNATRAVGNACNQNPILIIVPCHRVIAKNGKISGFAFGSKLKEHLLEIESSIG